MAETRSVPFPPSAALWAQEPIMIISIMISDIRNKTLSFVQADLL